MPPHGLRKSCNRTTEFSKDWQGCLVTHHSHNLLTLASPPPYDLLEKSWCLVHGCPDIILWWGTGVYHGSVLFVVLI